MVCYQTIRKDTVFEFTEKKSIFLTHAFFVPGEETARARVQEICRQHKDATHNVYAYCLHQGGFRKMSDDGEPSGTAGMPVLNTILKAGIEDVCVVVTRYFGGILLGAGGLVRAYTRGAAGALEQGGRANIVPFIRCRFQYGYESHARMQRVLEQASAMTETEYGMQVSVRALLRQDRFERLEAVLREQFFASVTWEILECFLSRDEG